MLVIAQLTMKVQTSGGAWITVDFVDLAVFFWGGQFGCNLYIRFFCGLLFVAKSFLSRMFLIVRELPQS